MKWSTFICLITAGFLLASCSKPAGESHDNISLLRHKWNLVSHNGEALRYVGQPGDFFTFEVSGRMYEVYGGKRDTFSYTFDGLQSLPAYPVQQGIRSATPVNYHVDILTNSLLVMSADIAPAIHLVDSLNR